MLSLDRQATNEVVIEGQLQETDFREGKLPARDGRGERDYVAGTVTIRVVQEVAGVEEVNEIPVSVFATKLKNDGNPNPAYANINQLRETYISLASGAARADYIRVTRGEINENTFVADGRLITGFRIRNSFFNKVTTDAQEIAAFKNKIVLLSIAPEINLANEETGRLKIVGGLVRYGSTVDVITYYVEDPTAIAFISKNWVEGETVNISGRLRFTVAAEEKVMETEELGFGEALPIPTSRRVKELIITSGSPGGLDEDESYDAEGEIMQALNERKARLDAEVEKSTKKETPSPATRSKVAFDGGF